MSVLRCGRLESKPERVEKSLLAGNGTSASASAPVTPANTRPGFPDSDPPGVLFRSEFEPDFSFQFKRRCVAPAIVVGYVSWPMRRLFSKWVHKPSYFWLAFIIGAMDRYFCTTASLVADKLVDCSMVRSLSKSAMSVLNKWTVVRAFSIRPKKDSSVSSFCWHVLYMFLFALKADTYALVVLFPPAVIFCNVCNSQMLSKSDNFVAYLGSPLSSSCSAGVHCPCITPHNFTIFCFSVFFVSCILFTCAANMTFAICVRSIFSI